MTIEETQNQIIEELSMFEEWMDKFAYIIELGKSLEEYPKTELNENHLIKACQSNLWLRSEFVDGKMIYKAEGEAIITKGLAALLIRVLSNHTPEEIISAKIFFIEQSELSNNLTPTRSNGLNAMICRMVDDARKNS